MCQRSGVTQFLSLHVSNVFTNDTKVTGAQSRGIYDIGPCTDPVTLEGTESSRASQTIHKPANATHPEDSIIRVHDLVEKTEQFIKICLLPLHV